jgi:hypothetical protein
VVLKWEQLCDKLSLENHDKSLEKFLLLYFSTLRIVLSFLLFWPFSYALFLPSFTVTPLFSPSSFLFLSNALPFVSRMSLSQQFLSSKIPLLHGQKKCYGKRDETEHGEDKQGGEWAKRKNRVKVRGEVKEWTEAWRREREIKEEIVL